jgi:hypothetical protein
MTPSVVFRWVDASSKGESCLIPPHEIVHAACHRRLGVSGWVCMRSRRDTNRRRALLRAVPEYGQVVWSNNRDHQRQISMRRRDKANIDMNFPASTP